MSTPVSVTTGTHGGVPIAQVRGEVDLSNVADVRAAIAAVVTNAQRGLIVDLTETTYIDSRGVHLLFEIAERLTRSQQQLFVVVPSSSPIHRLLAITHFEQAASITATARDAVARLGGQESGA